MGLLKADRQRGFKEKTKSTFLNKCVAQLMCAILILNTKILQRCNFTENYRREGVTMVIKVS